jgi:hypothetical protein
MVENSDYCRSSEGMDNSVFRNYKEVYLGDRLVPALYFVIAVVHQKVMYGGRGQKSLQWQGWTLERHKGCTATRGQCTLQGL